jgi:hypothetical protein
MMGFRVWMMGDFQNPYKKWKILTMKHLKLQYRVGHALCKHPETQLQKASL